MDSPFDSKQIPNPPVYEPIIYPAGWRQLSTEEKSARASLGYRARLHRGIKVYSAGSKQWFSPAVGNRLYLTYATCKPDGYWLTH